jgi:hypothetical protein
MTMAHVSQPDSRQGIMRAIGHALDMNQNGKLDAKEFEEFHRYLMGLATDNGTMEQYIAEREDGSFDRARKYAGHPPNVDVHDNQKKREAIMSKVAPDFATQLWQAGPHRRRRVCSGNGKARHSPRWGRADRPGAIQQQFKRCPGSGIYRRVQEAKRQKETIGAEVK